MGCIWYVSKYVAPPGTGSAGSRGHLIMRELAGFGHHCVIITSDSNALADVPHLDEPYLRQEIGGLEYWWIRTLKYRVAKSVRRILSWLDFEWRLWRMPKASLTRPDVVIVSSLSLLTILNGFLMRRRYRCRLVFEIRDIWPLTIVAEGGFSPRNPLVKLLGYVEKLGYRYADVVVGTMPNLGEHVRDILGRPRATHCIPMGVDDGSLDTAAPIPADYVKRYIPDGPFVVAHVGSIGITNALGTFLECAASMQHRDDIHFLLVGDGDLRSQYQNAYGNLLNVTFAPRVPKSMVQSVLVRCDLVYFAVHRSAVWTFGQSLNKVIDYMIAGKPILASYTGYPSMINEACCGTFVEAEDLEALKSEIQRYAAMPPEEREEMGRRGREWILANRRYRTLAEEYESILGLAAPTEQ